MKSELKNGTLVLKGTNRDGKWNMSYGTVEHFKTHSYPIPDEVTEIVESKLALEEISLDDYPFKTVPWSHQEEGMKWFLSHKRCALTHCMGSGKTKTALDSIGFLFWKGRAKRALVIAPIAVHPQWVKQFKQHASFGSMYVSKDTASARKFCTEDLDSLTNTIYLINYEKIQFVEKELLKAKFDVIICDESTKIKNHGAKRTKALAKIARNATYVANMTGTPITRNLVDLFGQYLVMDQFWFGKSYWGFRNRYCRMGGWMQKQVVGYYREEELRRIIDLTAHTVLKKDVLAYLPPKIPEERVVQMDELQQHIYNRTATEFLVEIDNGVIDIKNAVSRITRLQQIANGFAVNQNGDQVHISNSKINAVMDVIEEVEETEPIVIWCRFHHDINELRQRIGEKFPTREIFELSGKTKDHGVLLESYENSINGVLLAQIQTGGVGIDLSFVHTSIIFSNTFSYGDREQLEDRCHRPGLKTSVTYVDMVVEDSVDRKIQQVLNLKKSLSQWVLEKKGNLRDLLAPVGVFRSKKISKKLNDALRHQHLVVEPEESPHE